MPINGKSLIVLSESLKMVDALVVESVEELDYRFDQMLSVSERHMDFHFDCLHGHNSSLKRGKVFC